MFHAPIHTPPTPIAAQAIIAQITDRGECDGEYCADLNGQEHTFTAWFDTEWQRVGEYRQRDYDEASCTLIGAYAFNEDGLVWAVGNRSEIAALIGEAEVCRWEMEQSERRTEEG